MALALLPAMTMLGFGLLAVLPTLVVIVGFQVLRRAGNFALTRPAREILFTVVPREDRSKANAFIDPTVYRPGDQVVPGPTADRRAGLGRHPGGGGRHLSFSGLARE